MSTSSSGAQSQISQQVLAERSGLSWPTISRIERGVADVGIDAIERIAQALQLHPAELLLEPHSSPVTDADLKQRAAAPQSYFIDADDLLAAVDEAAVPSSASTTDAGRHPRVQRRRKRLVSELSS